VLLNSAKDESGDVMYYILNAMNYGCPAYIKASPLREPTYTFHASDIEYVAATRVREGDYNQVDLVAVVKLLNGDWAAFEAGCDTTGWDCQSYCDIRVGSNLSDVVNYGLSEEGRRVLMQLLLKKPDRILRVDV
jgi:hypothetical protein